MYFTLARRVVEALRGVPLIQDVVIVTSSAEVESFAGHLQVRVAHQLRDEGINVACEAAIRQFFPAAASAANPSATSAGTALILPGDLPLVTSDCLSALLQAAHLRDRGVTIVPDRRHIGTNALVCTPPDAIRLHFGPNSFAEHLRTAREHELEVRIFESGELALDIDEPEDFDAWRGYDTQSDVGAISAVPGLASSDLSD
jgi:2-phospho-L-lactate guanylyltransferase